MEGTVNPASEQQTAGRVGGGISLSGTLLKNSRAKGGKVLLQRIRLALMTDTAFSEFLRELIESHSELRGTRGANRTISVYGELISGGADGRRCSPEFQFRDDGVNRSAFTLRQSL